MKIPKQAKRVFRGVIFDVYHWRQKMFDGTYETFEMLKRPDTVLVIPIENGKIIIADQRQPNRGRFISFLGGRQSPGETPLQTAKRELLEEGGMKSAAWELYKKYKVHSKMDWNIHYFIARECEAVAKPQLDPGEKITLRAINFEEFVDLVCSEDSPDVQFSRDMLRMKMKPKELAEFKNKLFGKK
jgi:ADP-ribose pyrophosphatase